MTDEQGERTAPSPVETVKRESRFLRGTILASLADPVTASVREHDQQLLKFHGTYQQDDRDLREERRRQRLEPAYQFMVRVRTTGGIVTPEQWLTLDRLAGSYGDGSIRLTSRQAVQLHGVLKWNLKATIAEINRVLLTTFGACGDVNRNVMCTPNELASPVHAAVYGWAKALSAHLSPRTRAYHEIWLDGEKVVNGMEEEPLYGPTYLPRKFKIAMAIPPWNDVDVFAQDLGFIAIAEGNRLLGFDVAVGGGMGATYGDPATYPRLADVIGFIPAEATLELAEAVLTVQRDYGDRSNRKQARLKYTIDARGLDWFRGAVEAHLGWRLEPARPFTFRHRGDRLGFGQAVDGSWYCTVFLENGRIRDDPGQSLRAGFRRLAEIHGGDFRLTPNQNCILYNIAPEAKAEVARLLGRHGLLRPPSRLRQRAMACVAFPTCGLAMAESERYLPHLLTKLEALLAEVGLGDEEIVVRMSGCPNGCSRPYLAEIGFTGKGPGTYNLYLGGDAVGGRLNVLYREAIDEAEILSTLRPILARYQAERRPGERFGDFVRRLGYVSEVSGG